MQQLDVPKFYDYLKKDHMVAEDIIIHQMFPYVVLSIPCNLLCLQNYNNSYDHLLGYYLCLNTYWKTLEVLKTKKYYYFHMTSFRWLPY